MKVCRAICCFSLSVCCFPAFGQQVLAGAGSRPSLAPAQSARLLADAKISSSSPKLPSATSDYSYLPMFGSLARESYPDIMPLPTGELVCTQPFARAAIDQPSDYAFGRLQFSGAAIKGTFTHDNLVKMARNFVPGQPVPNSPSYVPLTARQKFDLFLRNTRTPGFGLGILADSIISEASGAYPRFGGGMEGYGQRLGAAAAGEGSAAFFGGFVFPTLLHQDPRYFRSRQNAISNRLAYAASRVIIGRSDDGRNVINLSVIMSQFVQAAVSNAYIPYRNETVSGTLENAVAGLGAVAQADILNEFWPDIKEFFRRHDPETLVRKKNPSVSNVELASRN